MIQEGFLIFLISVQGRRSWVGIYPPRFGRTNNVENHIIVNRTFPIYCFPTQYLTNSYASHIWTLFIFKRNYNNFDLIRENLLLNCNATSEKLVEFSFLALEFFVEHLIFFGGNSVYFYASINAMVALDIKKLFLHVWNRKWIEFFPWKDGGSAGFCQFPFIYRQLARNRAVGTWGSPRFRQIN